MIVTSFEQSHTHTQAFRVVLILTVSLTAQVPDDGALNRPYGVLAGDDFSDDTNDGVTDPKFVWGEYLRCGCAENGCGLNCSCCVFTTLIDHRSRVCKEMGKAEGKNISNQYKISKYSLDRKDKDRFAAGDLSRFHEL